MKSVDEVNGKELKAVCKSLNDAKIVDNVRYIGVKLPTILETFVEAVENIPEENADNIPDDVIDFYNDLIGDEVEGDDPNQGDVEEPVAEEPEEEPVEEEPKKEKKPKKKKSVVGIRVGRTVYPEFADYEKSLRGEGPETPTNYLDLIFLDGATPQEVVDLFAEFVKDNKLTHGGYKRPSLVIEHIEARAKNAGFIFDKDGDKYTLIGAKK
jgi:hypothetical protein